MRTKKYEKHKEFFSILIKCGWVEEDYAINELGMTKNQLQDYTSKSILNWRWHRRPYQSDFTKAYSLGLVGRDELKDYLPIATSSPHKQILYTDFYTSLSEEEKETWSSESETLYRLKHEKEWLKEANPELFEELMQVGISGHCCSYYNTKGECIIVAYQSSDKRTLASRENYAKMVQELSKYGDGDTVHFVQLIAKGKNLKTIMKW